MEGTSKVNSQEHGCLLSLPFKDHCCQVSVLIDKRDADAIYSQRELGEQRMASSVFNEIEGNCSAYRGEGLRETLHWKLHTSQAAQCATIFFGGYRTALVLTELQME